MLYHLGELRQVSLHELQGFGGLRKTREGWQSQLAPLPFVPVLWASSVPERHGKLRCHGTKTMLACLKPMTWDYRTAAHRRTSCCSENGDESQPQHLEALGHQVSGFSYKMREVALSVVQEQAGEGSHVVWKQNRVWRVALICFKLWCLFQFK